ncbi:hypothetical protein PGB90_007193 [Kerria lacca]
MFFFLPITLFNSHLIQLIVQITAFRLACGKFPTTPCTSLYATLQRTTALSAPPFNLSENIRTPSPSDRTTFPFSFHLIISPSLCYTTS